MKCPNCGKEIANDSLFCEFCGTKVKKTTNKWLLWLIGILAIVCIAVVTVLTPKQQARVDREVEKYNTYEEETEPAYDASYDYYEQSAVKEAKQQLEAVAEYANAMLGGQDMNGMTMTCTFDGTNLVYNYIVDENYVSMDDIQANKSMLKSYLESTPECADMIESVKVLDGKVIYNYTGKYSGRKITEKISF